MNQKSDEHTTEAMWRRLNERMLAKVGDGPPPRKLALRTADFPLDKWISTTDLARKLDVQAVAVYSALWGRLTRRVGGVDLEHRLVKRGGTRVTEWRWKR